MICCRSGFSLSRLLLLLVLLSGAGTRAENVVLIKDGAPLAAIVLTADADDNEKLAAKELVDHLQQMSGATIPVVESADHAALPIYIGPGQNQDAKAALGAEADESAFWIRVAPTSIHLAGVSSLGTRFAALELLERLGVRWFFPGALGTVVPQRTTVALEGFEAVCRPSFSGRRLQDVSGDFAARRRAGGMDGGAHGLGVHFNRGTEPELFVELPGGNLGMVKVSHPEVYRRVLRHWRAKLEADPDMKYLQIGPDDGGGFGSDPWDAGDMDPLHGKVSVTDRYVKFFNLLLADLQKDYPDVGIGFYCYAQYMRPPVREQPNPKILPVLAPIDVCRLHAIDNPICPERAYIRDIVEGWQALGVQMMYRGYLFNLADQGFPFSMIRQLRAELPYYKSTGFLACRIETKPTFGYGAPSYYLAYRLMWDTELDVDAVMDEYFTRLYGEAAAPMQAHFARLERVYKEADYHTGNVFDIPHILTPDTMDELRRSLEEAEQAADDETIRARVNMIRIGYDYGVANLEMMAAVNAFDFVTAKAAYDRITLEIVPSALEHDPPILNPLYAKAFPKRFWKDTVMSGYERATGGYEVVARLPDRWQFLLDPLNGGERLGFWQSGMGDRNWTTLRTYTTSWSNQGLRYYKGECWYRTRVEIPERFSGRPLELWLGGIDDHAKAWINSRPLTQLAAGRAPTGTPWIFDTGEAVHTGQNVIVVKVTNRQVDELGTGGITGPCMIWAPPE